MAEYLCWMPGSSEREDATIIHAFDAWSAAKEYAKRADNDSGSDISNDLMDSGDKLRVHVLGPDGVETLWDVWPDIVIHWYGCAAGIVEQSPKEIGGE